jgi:hypothetical protein
MSHERTQRLLAEHGAAAKTDLPIRITINPTWAATTAGQTILIALTNTVCRFSSRVIIDAPEHALTAWSPWGTSALLSGRCTEIAHALGASPFQEPAALIVHVGNARPTEQPTILVSADGWTGHATWQPTIPGAPEAANPIGALVAAALGAGLAFRHVITTAGGKAPDSEDILSLNALAPGRNANPPWQPPVIQDPFMIVGGGAVAHSTTYALHACAATGSGLVIDGQEYKDTGFNRYLLVPPNVRGPKAALVAATATASLRLAPVNQDYGPWRDTGATAPPIAVSTVDDRDWNRARKELQTDLPRHLVHAATGRLTVSVANINFLEGPCLGCIFFEAAANENIANQLAALLQIRQEEALELFFGNGALSRTHLERIATLVARPLADLLPFEGKPGREFWGEETCAIMKIPTPSGTVAGTASHITLLAGTLAAVELAKLNRPDLATFIEPIVMQIPVYLPSAAHPRRGKSLHHCAIMCQDPILQSAWTAAWRTEGQP